MRNLTLLLVALGLAVTAHASGGNQPDRTTTEQPQRVLPGCPRDSLAAAQNRLQTAGPEQFGEPAAHAPAGMHAQATVAPAVIYVEVFRVPVTPSITAPAPSAVPPPPAAVGSPTGSGEETPAGAVDPMLNITVHRKF